MTRRFSHPRFVAVAAAVLAVAVTASACGRDTARTADACPQVLLDRDTARLTLFRDGPGRDLTDVVLEAEVVGYTGDCAPGKAGQPVVVEVQPMFAVTKGPAWDGRAATLSYFLAIPDHFPAPEAKQIYGIAATFPTPTTTRVMLRDEKVSLRLPLAETAHRAPPVYLGFQLTADQLDHNRRTR